jgi:hypothetical protein
MVLPSAHYVLQLDRDQLVAETAVAQLFNYQPSAGAFASASSRIAGSQSLLLLVQPVNL